MNKLIPRSTIHEFIYGFVNKMNVFIYCCDYYEISLNNVPEFIERIEKKREKKKKIKKKVKTIIWGSHKQIH